MSSSPHTDQELLRRHLAAPSGDAFGELVGRHLGLVHASARRQLDGDAHGAEDVCQAVFTELARKASQLTRHPTLVGWLYTTTRYLAQHHRREIKRRQERERKAEFMHRVDDGQSPDWTALRPVLDDAMQGLRETDRVAVLLRFFEGQDLRSVGAALGVSEDAARMRVDRALERLRRALAARGITATAAVLVAGLPVQAVEIVPAAIAAQVVSSALASAGAVSAAGTAFGTLGGLTQVSAPMIAMKTPIIVTTIAAAVLVVPLALQQQRLDAAQLELAALGREVAGLAELRAEHERLRGAPARARELEELRGLQGEFARLRSEAEGLRRDVGVQATDPAVKPAMEDLRAAERTRDEAAARAEFRKDQKVVINAMKNLGLAARIFATDHEDRFPTRFEEMSGEIPTDLAGNPVLDRFEFFPQPRAVGESEPQLFLFREKQARRRPDGGWERAYTLADGSVQALSSPTEDFTQVEKERGGVASMEAPQASPDKP